MNNADTNNQQRRLLHVHADASANILRRPFNGGCTPNQIIVRRKSPLIAVRRNGWLVTGGAERRSVADRAAVRRPRSPSRCSRASEARARRRAAARVREQGRAARRRHRERPRRQQHRRQVAQRRPPRLTAWCSCRTAAPAARSTATTACKAATRGSKRAGYGLRFSNPPW